MFKVLVLSTLMFSVTVMAKIEIEQKQGRVEFIDKIGVIAPSVAVDAYHRELQYEIAELPLMERARMETNLLAEKIKMQVVRAYEVELNNGLESSFAKKVVQDAIEKDLELAAPEFKEELRSLAIETLINVEQGESIHSDLVKVEKIMLENVKARSAYLNQHEVAAMKNSHESAAFNVKKNGAREIILEYPTRDSLVKKLLSSEESARWVATTNMSIRSNKAFDVENRVSLQVKISFLGVSVEAGPVISFYHRYGTNATIMAEGLHPVVLSDGNFDYYQRDQSGNIIYKDGNPVRRFMSFYCEVENQFEQDKKMTGSLRIGGIGSDNTVNAIYQNSVSLTSRRVEVPNYVGEKTVTVELLGEICHKEFLKAKINKNMTVADSLNVMMKNAVSTLVYSHPKTKCVVDSHCFNWFNRELVGLVKLRNTPRCIEESREKFWSCEVRGLKGQNCPVYKNGERISDGMFEFICDKGLSCVQYQKAGWFKEWNIYQYAKGKCMPASNKIR